MRGISLSRGRWKQIYRGEINGFVGAIVSHSELNSAQHIYIYVDDAIYDFAAGLLSRMRLEGGEKLLNIRYINVWGVRIFFLSSLEDSSHGEKNPIAILYSTMRANERKDPREDPGFLRATT